MSSVLSISFIACPLTVSERKPPGRDTLHQNDSSPKCSSRILQPSSTKITPPVISARCLYRAPNQHPTATPATEMQKVVTLEENGNALFPDAPTERGVKHIRELQRAAETGLDAVLFFVVQIRDIHSVAPNDVTHPAFGEALREAAAHGVRVLAYDCDVTPDSLKIRREVPVIL